jgi:hypothetical protein
MPFSQREVKVRIARKGIESSESLGRYRWVVGRRDDLHQDFPDLGCAIIYWNQIQRLCWAL